MGEQSCSPCGSHKTDKEMGPSLPFQGASPIDLIFPTRPLSRNSTPSPSTILRVKALAMGTQTIANSETERFPNGPVGFCTVGLVKPPLKRSRSAPDGGDEETQEQLQDQIAENSSIEEEEKTDNATLLRLLEEGEKVLCFQGGVCLSSNLRQGAREPREK